MPKLHDKAIIRFDEDETANFLDEVENGMQLTKKQKEKLIEQLNDYLV